LTTAEDYFRHQQGLESLPGGFNAYYIYDHVFPRPWLPVVGLVWLSLVVVSYVGTVVLWRRRRAAAADPVSVG